MDKQDDYLSDIEQGIEKDTVKLCIRNYDYFMLPYTTNLKKLKIIDCCLNKLEIVNDLAPNLEELYCRNNKIIDFEFPDSLQILDCSDNPLISLKLPKNLRVLKAKNCNLMSLELNQNLTDLDVSNNLLVYLQDLPHSLVNLKCSYNFLIELNCPYNLLNLDISHNNIRCITVNFKLEVLNAYATCITKFDKTLRTLTKLVVPKVSIFVSPLIKSCGVLHLKSCLIVLKDFFNINCWYFCKRRKNHRKKICKEIKVFFQTPVNLTHILEIYRNKSFYQPKEKRD